MEFSEDKTKLWRNNNDYYYYNPIAINLFVSFVLQVSTLNGGQFANLVLPVGSCLLPGTMDIYVWKWIPNVRN